MPRRTATFKRAQTTAVRVYPATKVPRAVRRAFPKITEMVDADENVLVTVTPTDVKNAKIKNAGHCAFANAIGRQYQIKGIQIGLTRAYLVKGKRCVRFITPESVSREVVSFDRKAGFAPGNYHLAAVPKSQRGGPKRKRKNSRSGPSGRSTRPIIHTSPANVRVIK